MSQMSPMFFHGGKSSRLGNPQNLQKSWHGFCHMTHDQRFAALGAPRTSTNLAAENPGFHTLCHQTLRAGKWTIEIGDFPILKPPFSSDFPASHV